MHFRYHGHHIIGFKLPKIAMTDNKNYHGQVLLFINSSVVKAMTLNMMKNSQKESTTPTPRTGPLVWEEPCQETDSVQ